jgi:hypothetical protein
VENSLIELDPIDLVGALGLMAIAIGLSSWQKLGTRISACDRHWQNRCTVVGRWFYPSCNL